MFVVLLFRDAVVYAGRAFDQEETVVRERRGCGRGGAENGETPNGRVGRLRAPGVPGVHVGAVSDSTGHHAQAILLSENVLGVHHGSSVHGAHFAGLSTGRCPRQRNNPVFRIISFIACRTDRNHNR